MTPEQRAQIIQLLKKGEDLSPEWARILFPPEKREYELVYHGKEREEDILANKLAVPLQPVRTFGNNVLKSSRNTDGNGADNWQHMLIFGDNLQVMKSLLEMKKAGKLCNEDGTPGVRLVYIDPPFATKQEFRGTQDQKAYQDKLAGAEFIEFLRKRLAMMRELLSDDGAIYVHLDTKKSHYIKIVLDEVFGESNFKNEIIWKRQSAHSDSNKCGAIHDTIFFYSRSSQWIWNEVLTEPSPDYIEQFFDQVEPETNRRYARGDLSAGGLSGGGYEYEFNGIKRIWRCPKTTLRKYEADGRLHWPNKGVPRLKRYLDEFKGVPLQDVWADVRIIHNRSEERIGYPTQKPEALIERIIRTSSNEGDIIFDAFSGSGTTCAVAEKLGRRWIGIDCGKLAIYTMQKRLLNLRKEIGNKGPEIQPKPFTLYNAGLYDFSKLKELRWEDWRFFALQLFQCRDELHSTGGIQLDGYLKGASVLVFNHLKHPGARFTDQTLDELHEALGTRIGNRMFIIAPALTFDFQQDYVDKGNVRYYALRIPYSIINELHQRSFSALKQPSDEMAVNDTVEAVGFDFIRTPELKFKCGSGKRKGQLFEEAFIRLKTFKSEAVIREPLRKKGNLETLSMVMLDYDYDEKSQVFDLDAVFYAETLAKQNWEVRFLPENLGDKLMAVFIDIYGNEARVVLDAAEFGVKAKKVTKTEKRGRRAVKA